MRGEEDPVVAGGVVEAVEENTEAIPKVTKNLNLTCLMRIS